MKNKKYTKAKVELLLGLFNLLISTFFVKDNFEIFLFFFIMFSICFFYNRKLVLNIIGRPIIKEIVKLNNIKYNLHNEIQELENRKKELIAFVNTEAEKIKLINEYNYTINQLETKIKKLNTEIIKLEDKRNIIEQIIKQEEIVNRAIEGEEKTFNILSEENKKLESKKEQLVEEIDRLNKKIKPITSQIEFLNKCNFNYIDSLNGFEFEKFCVNLLKINGYENIQNTQESVDYGIDIIAEKDKIIYTIQCKRYEGKVGNDAIQEAMTGKEYYDGHIAIVLTNSTFTSNAKRLAESAGVILWDREILQNMIERNKIKHLLK